jgi:glycosyltransferase involved in cell wall biosynthesis
MAATAIAIISAPTHLPLVVTRRSEFRPERTTFSKWKYSQVDAFVATNGSVRQRLLAEGIPASRVALIPPGVDVDRIDRVEPANLHAELFLPTNAPVVGNIGILDPQKGLQHLIAAAGLVLHDVPDARFVLMGEGPLHQALTRDVHARHLDRHVFLPGFHADSARHLKGFDVYASAALHVTGSLALIEAMAASRPIVATAVGHVPDLIEDGVTGLLVPPRDERALAAAITLLLKDADLRAALGESARARARSEFSLERMVEATAGLYERCRETARIAS